MLHTNEVSKNPTIKNSMIVMAMNKQLISSSPNYWNFVVGSKWFIQSGLGSMDNIMVLKEYYEFKYVNDIGFHRQSKDKFFIFKMFVDIAGSGIDLIRCMQCAGNMKYFFDNI